MNVMARLRALALAALVGATLTACDETVMDPGIFDPEMTAASMAEMAAAGDEMGEAWVGMSLAGSLFESTSAAELLPGGGSLLLDPAGTARYADLMETAAFFPSNYLGVTFVWDETEESYVASEETGAPQDGIRVIYYAVDPFTYVPASPLTPLGHIDLRDLSTPSSDRLGVRIERTAGTAATLADYFIDISYTYSGDELGLRQVARGYLSDGSARLNFDLEGIATISETEITVEQTFEMALAGTDARVEYHAVVTSDWEGQNTTVSLEAYVAGSGTSVRFVVDVQGETLSGEVYHGSSLVATISGSVEQPLFTNAATGEELTPAQLEALAEVFRAVEGLFGLAQGIFGITG